MALPIILTIVTYFSDKDIILFQLLFPGFDTRLFAMQPRCHGRASFSEPLNKHTFWTINEAKKPLLHTLSSPLSRIKRCLISGAAL